MELAEVFEPVCCAVGLSARDKEQALWKLSELAIRSQVLEGVDSETIYNALADRESQGSTGFGKEIAMPHARLPNMGGFLVFAAVFPKGVPFDAVDNKKVRIFFVILGPGEQVQEHLRLLAGISRIMAHTNARQELLHSRTNEVLVESIQRYIGQAENRATAPVSRSKLMVLTLYIEEHIYEILELFLEFGIEGASILESSGMGRYISNVPLFAEFIGFMNENKNASQTIMAIVPERHVQPLVQRIEEITGDLDKREGAALMVLDVSYFKGTMKML